MRYKSFNRLILLTVAVLVIASFVIVGACITIVARRPTKETPVAQSTTPAATTSSGGGGSMQQSTRASTDELKQKLGLWLTLNSDRQGLMKKENILPNESFRATAIRFPQSEAVKWSNKESQWSQIKIDLDRNGLDDEKWLLKNGELYKREVIDSSGKTAFMEYFK